jgi:hypothetical protein
MQKPFTQLALQQSDVCWHVPPIGEHMDPDGLHRPF